MQKFFITGASGFIGKHLLHAIDGDVRVLSRAKYMHYNTVVCDLGRELIPENCLEGIDTVFHLAGLAHDVRDATEIQKLYYNINVRATKRLAELAVASNVKKFVYVSSVKAGGLPPFEKCANEESKSEPDGIYGKTKKEAELALLDITKESDMHVSIIRPSLVYGPKVKGNLQLMLSGIEKRWFPPLPKIGNKRSMIHVDDLVRAILLVAEDARANREIFITTDGSPYSSQEIYSAMCDVVGKPIPRWSVPAMFFDIASMISPRIKYKINKLLGDECYSSDKIEKLGFKAKKTLRGMNETSF